MGIFVVELFISYITCLQLPFNYCFDLFLEPELKARKQMRLPLSPSPPSAVCKCKLPVRDAQAGYTALTPEELGLQRGPGTALTPAPRSGARCWARRRLPGGHPTGVRGPEKLPPADPGGQPKLPRNVPLACLSKLQPLDLRSPFRKFFRKKTEKGVAEVGAGSRGRPLQHHPLLPPVSAAGSTGEAGEA